MVPRSVWALVGALGLVCLTAAPALAATPRFDHHPRHVERWWHRWYRHRRYWYGERRTTRSAQGAGSATAAASGAATSSQGGAASCGLPTTGETLHLVATAYAPTAQDNYPYGPVDYYGQPLKAGDVAVDPNVIPLGTHLWVTGYHSPYLPPGGFCAIADDTGGAIKGDRIDIFINASERQVNSFGIQDVTATILK